MPYPKWAAWFIRGALLIELVILAFGLVIRSFPLVIIAILGFAAVGASFFLAKKIRNNPQNPYSMSYFLIMLVLAAISLAIAMHTHDFFRLMGD